MSAAPAAPRGHARGLDGLRGLAILMVLCVHFIGDEAPQSAAEHVAVKLANYGVWGVDLFFVLSGFLITGILRDTRGSPRYLRDFYARRVLRIFPLYFGTLLLLFGVLPRLPFPYPAGLAEARAHQAWLWTYACNLYVARAGSWALPYVSHFWSLAVEEHFYLVWPFVVRACSGKALSRVCFAGIAGALALRCALAAAGASEVTLVALTPCRVDAFCVGALGAMAVRERGLADASRAAHRLAAPLGGLVVAASALHVATHGAFGSLLLPLRGSLISLFFGAVVVMTFAAPAAGWNGRLFQSRPMCALGRYSYGLYVIHGVVAYAMQARGATEALTERLGSHLLAIAVEASLGATASFLLAVLSYELLEKHFLLLKDRVAPRTVACNAAVRG